MDYIYLLELRRFNPNSNIAQSPEAAFIHQSLTAFHFHEGVDVLEKQPHYIRNNLYMQIRNLIEQLDLDSVVGLDKFPRHERLGLAKSIRDGYVELITVLNEGEQIPSLRKQSIKEFSKVLQNILCYYNFSYNRRYVSIHIVCRWAKRLAEISKLHDRYVKIILNKISTDTNEYT